MDGVAQDGVVGRQGTGDVDAAAVAGDDVRRYRRIGRPDLVGGGVQDLDPVPPVAQSTGAGGLGNGWDGIQILDSTANEIGSADPAVPPNVITSNRRGVYVTGPLSADNPILGNSIHDNAGLGIELNPNLVTSPVATTVTATGGTTSITWHVVVAANTRYRLEWFASTACDGSGSGEGTTFLDFREFTTKNLTDVFIPTTVTEPSGTVITATLTVMLSPTTYGSTSEFSPCVTVP